tara:strand:+ start:4255 stop:4482 length:228 start_codon:yes stop_codon:yes gene_type:complete
MTIYEIQSDEFQRNPVVTNRVFHWEHLPQKTQNQIITTINNVIDNEISENLSPGSDIIEAEVVVQVTIHTQVAEY